MSSKEQVFSTEWHGRTLTFKTGLLAKQADSSVTVQYGDTVVLATVVKSKEERPGINYFPLMIDLEEKLYAAGIIKGSRWIKREGRPTDDAVLSGRMIDRSVRPLFDDSGRKAVQVVLNVLSVDKENDHDIVAMVAASAALSISGVKWDGPIGGIRMGRVDGKLIANPTYAEREKSDFDLIVAGTEQKTIMIEAGAKEVSEDDMYEAIVAGQAGIQPAVKLIKELISTVGVKKFRAVEAKKSIDELESEKKKEEAIVVANNWLKENVNKILFTKEHYSKGERKLAVALIKEGLEEFLFSDGMAKDMRSYASNATVEKVIDFMDRRVNVNQVREMIHLSKKYGIETGTFIMLGYPGETEKDIEETIDHLKKSNPDYFTITLAYPIKGTDFYQEIETDLINSFNWNLNTDRERVFKRTYSRKYYGFAIRRVVNEVNFHKTISNGRQLTFKNINYKARSLAAKTGMLLLRKL